MNQNIDAFCQENKRTNLLQCVGHMPASSAFTWSNVLQSAHYTDVIMGTIAPQITSLTIVY